MSKQKSNYISAKTVKNALFTTGLLLIIYILIVLYLPLFAQRILILYQEGIYIFRFLTPILDLFLIYFVLGHLTIFALISKVNKIKISDFIRNCHFTLSDYVVDLSFLILLIFIATYFSLIPLHLLGVGDSALLPIGFMPRLAIFKHPVFLFIYILATPLIEEYAYRGVFLRFLGRYSNHFALFMVSMFYALAHTSLAEFVPAFILSYYLGRLTLYYRSILPAIFLHLSFNIFNCLLVTLTEDLFIYLSLAILTLFIAVIAYLLFKGFKKITIKKSPNTNYLLYLWFSNPALIIAMLLLIVHSFLAYIL